MGLTKISPQFKNITILRPISTADSPRPGAGADTLSGSPIAVCAFCRLPIERSSCSTASHCSSWSTTTTAPPSRNRDRDCFSGAAGSSQCLTPAQAGPLRPPSVAEEGAGAGGGRGGVATARLGLGLGGAGVRRAAAAPGTPIQLPRRRPRVRAGCPLVVPSRASARSRGADREGIWICFGEASFQRAFASSAYRMRTFVFSETTVMVIQVGRAILSRRSKGISAHAPRLD
jgi:hypothetical protein